MNLSWWWCKHFHVVYLLIIITALLSPSLSSSSATGNEPTEEPEETNTAILTNASGTTIFSTATSENENIYGSSSMKTNSEDEKIKVDTNAKERMSERFDDDHLQARALFRSSAGNVLKSASKMVSKGLRMFRESLLEGAKVAHMFKEDMDEGMSTIMRQNRGVKVDGPSQQQQSDTSNSGSFFDSQMLREGVLGGILRFMGINSKQMGVIALNCLIILAEWITSSMIGNNEVAGVTSRMIKTNLLQWASTGHNSQIDSLLTQARSHSLPEKLIDKLSEKTGNTTSCVQLLICKMTPVIWGVQDTVKDQLNYSDLQPDIKTARKAENDTNNNQRSSWGEPRGFLLSTQYLFDKFMGHLPEKERIVDFGDRCESKFPHCQLLKFNSLTVKY